MMAHFYGTLNGKHGQVTRLGVKESGLSAITASYQGAVEVRLRHDEETGKDVAEVSLIPWKGAGVRKLLVKLNVDGS